jgi:hypothetical protein
VQELALQRQLSKMLQEKTHYVQELFKEQVKLQLLDTQMDDMQSKLAAVCICFLLNYDSTLNATQNIQTSKLNNIIQRDTICIGLHEASHL